MCKFKNKKHSDRIMIHTALKMISGQSVIRLFEAYLTLDGEEKYRENSSLH